MRPLIDQRLAESPELADLWATWSACMADRGYEAADPDELAASFDDEFVALLADIAPGLVPADPADPLALTLTDEARAALEAFREREVAAAVASLECREPLQDRIDAVEARITDEVLAEEGVTPSS